MGRITFLRTGILAGATLILVGIGALLYELRGQATIESPGGSSALLEVLNRHFTIGRKIPSVYLRIFYDHTLECHSLSYTGEEADTVKKSVLTPEEFGRVKAVIDQPELLTVKRRYELTHSVVDSWMEWDIKIQHPGRVQEITVANFSPGSEPGPSPPYPDALLMLGCSISNLRGAVCGDESVYRRSNCEKALQHK
jgi:hypothetical protein